MKPLFFDHEVYLSNDENIPGEWISGNNRKGLLVICNSIDKTDENSVLLSKILSAVQYNVEEDCHLITLPKNSSISILNFIKKNNIKHLIIFGISPISLGFSMNMIAYKPLKINNTRMIFAHGLTKIDKNQEFKRALWNSLKTMFKA